MRARKPSGSVGGRGWVACVLLLPLLTGCFNYVPADPLTVSPDMDVRAVLHPESARRLGDGPDRAPRHLDGWITDLTADSVRFAVPVAGPEHRGTAFEGARRVYVLARPDILEFQRRELNRNRSMIAGLAAGAGIGILAFLVFDLGGSGGSPGDGPTPNGSQPTFIPH